MPGTSEKRNELSNGQNGRYKQIIVASVTFISKVFQRLEIVKSGKSQNNAGGKQKLLISVSRKCTEFVQSIGQEEK